MAAPYGNGRTVEQERQEMVLVIGENIQVRRFARFAANTSTPYIHAGGKIGVLVNFKVDGGIDATEIAQKDDLGTLIQQHTAGDTLSITVARDGQMQTVSLTLGEKNTSTNAQAAQRSTND